MGRPQEELARKDYQVDRNMFGETVEVTFYDKT